MEHTPWRIARPLSITCALLATAAAARAQTPPSPEQTSPTATAAPIAPAAPGTPADASASEQAGYLFGLTFGEQMHSVGITNQVDPDAVTRGIKEGLQGKKTSRADQQQLQAFVRTAMAESLTRNKAAAKEFLTRNGKDKAVKTTADGLEYKVLIPGDAKGTGAAPTDEVTVNYRGKLLDGTEFDSSYSRGAPATFKINAVIKGWQEALLLMKPGSKWQLYIPPELAYDANPRPGIPAGSLLIFEVELISVNASNGPAAPPGTPSPMGTPQSHKAVPPLTPSNQ